LLFEGSPFILLFENRSDNLEMDLRLHLISCSNLMINFNFARVISFKFEMVNMAINKTS